MLIETMAQRFLSTDGDIPSVLQALFDSSEFTGSLGKKFKDPMHYVVSSLRLAYDGKVILNTGPVLNWLTTLGEQPNGHLTPDGYALIESAWASPAQMANLFDIAKVIGRGTPNLFKPDNQTSEEGNEIQSARELAKINLAQNTYVKEIVQHYGANSQQALNQSAYSQEWNSFSFLRLK